MFDLFNASMTANFHMGFTYAHVLVISLFIILHYTVKHCK